MDTERIEQIKARLEWVNQHGIAGGIGVALQIALVDAPYLLEQLEAGQEREKAGLKKGFDGSSLSE